MDKLASLLAAYLVAGCVVAWAINAEFDIGGPIDPAASGSPSISKWVLLPLMALLWPIALLIPVLALIAKINNRNR